ncbi:hypothetical protein F66182_1506 [Fusarium sp. NRRL 66182]|nr:hypothetical protein F66182_1506 [Fusarium sp. NRRL 66182]
MPDGQISSLHNHNHNRYRPGASSPPEPTVAVAVSPPWALPAYPSSSASASTDYRRYHREPLRSAPSPSPSLVGAYPNHLPLGPRLPRTSSLLPPPHIEPSPKVDSFERSDRLSPTPGNGIPHNPAESSWLLNRLSASTISSRASVIPPRAKHARFGSRSSIDANSVIDNDSPSSQSSPRKLQKNPRRNASSISSADTFVLGSPEKRTQLPQALPLIIALSPLEPPTLDGLLDVKSEGAGPDPGPSEPGRSIVARQEGQSLTNPDTPESPDESVTSTPASVRSMSSHRPTMPYDQDQEAYAPQRGHSRSRSGKGSHDKGRGAKPPSQKAMLHRALQKANTAVQLDNAQNFTGAREAYAEACDLLQQVLQKTSADEDKRKLEAIRRTYTSRIDELDQMTPWQEEESKALPARPESLARHSESESVLRLDDDDDDAGAAIYDTAMVTRMDSHSPQPRIVNSPPRQEGVAHRRRSLQNKPKPIVTTLTPEPGLLQSSFSRSPVRLRTPEHLLQRPAADQYMPAPLSPRRPVSPTRPENDEMDEPVRSDFSMNSDIPVEPMTEQNVPHANFREESLNSWLDPIDESGGSTSSSVHSRTSSLGFRRKHIRAVSGDTEAEFDTALDAAIEAAYDDGYEPMSPMDHGRGMPMDQGEEAVATAMRRVELARQRVRETEQEAYDVGFDREARSQQQQQYQTSYTEYYGIPNDFYNDDSSDEEERILDEIARDYGLESYRSRPPHPRESDSSGATPRTWHSSQGSNPPTGATSLSTVTELPSPFTNISQAPAAPPPTQSLPELPQRPGSSAQSVRNRRLSGQNPKQLKIETSKLALPLQSHKDDSAQSRSALTNSEEANLPAHADTNGTNASNRPPSPPLFEASPTDTTGVRPAPSPLGQLGSVDGDDDVTSSPNAKRLRKNFSSSSLRSMRTRNMSLTNLEEGSDLSPGTPGSNPFGSLNAPSVPALPTPLATTFRERSETNAAGLSLFDDNFYSPTSPGSPNPLISDAPAPLEPCPTDFMLRPFWLMRCLYQTLAHPRGGYLSSKLFISRDVWQVKGVKLKNIEDKVANCDFLTAALLKIARADTYDADAVLEEMQCLEGILEQVQTALTRKLGNEVGVHGSGTLFKDASTGDGDATTGVPRSASVSGKSSFSWRRLRSKNSAIGLGGSYTSRNAAPEPGKDTPSIASLPMTPTPTNRPTKRDLAQVSFTGPNAMYMSSLARLFDAAQAIDQIARQVEDPGLRHADKTQVGLELCTRHAAEFFGFYVCRPAALEARIAAIPIERYRNFCIVAHIDHGKSTLSDRLLEYTGTISASDANKQILDKLDVERERGITVKAQTCTMIHNHKGEDYLLHLVDTPGHVDFRAEVTRSYASCGGALLLVDATQGIQAQTVSNFHLAFAQDLELVPVVNKIDMPAADIPRVLGQMEDSFELDPKDAVMLSAKTGKGVPDVLPAVIDRIPHPVGDEKKPLKMMLVDSWYDNFRGVVLLVRLFDGTLKAGDNVASLGTGMKYTVGQVGIQYPHAIPQATLSAGQVGYIYFNPGMKRIQDAKLGDTFTFVGSEDQVEPLPGFEEPKPMVFVAAFPTDQGDYSRLSDSIGQLVLNDRSVTLQKDHSEALGAGWRLGFLGSLHCSVFQDRLRQEHGRSVILTEPTVPSKIVWPDGTEEIVQNPALFPDTSHPRVKQSQLSEPYVMATITMPEEYLGRVIELCEANRGEQKSLEFFHATQVILRYEIPTAQLVDDLFGKLKSVTKGYATLDYEDAGWRESSLVKLQLLVNRQPVDAICKVVHTSQVDRLGRQWVTKFKEHVDRQHFEVVIQATAGNRIVARETIKPFRKDVLAKLHAADVSRRRKLLEKQKEGRKRLRAVGNVVIDQSAFQSFMSR